MTHVQSRVRTLVDVAAGQVDMSIEEGSVNTVAHFAETLVTPRRVVAIGRVGRTRIVQIALVVINARTYYCNSLQKI